MIDANFREIYDIEPSPNYHLMNLLTDLLSRVRKYKSTSVINRDRIKSEMLLNLCDIPTAKQILKYCLRISINNIQSFIFNYVNTFFYNL